MARPKSSSSERDSTLDKGEAILQGAMQEFLQHGYAGTSMDRVAKAAGVSKATIYSHFEDKEGLFAMLVKKLAEQKMMTVFGSTPLEGDPEVVFRKLMTNALKQISCDEEHRSYIRLIMGESERFPALARSFVKYQAKPPVDLLSQYLASCDELDIPDPVAMARILIAAMIHYVQIQILLDGGDIMPMDSDRYIDSLVHLIALSRKKQ